MSKITYTDHLGNTFSSIAEMSKYWNINYKTLINRLNKGWDIEKALITPILKKKQQCTDHLGNTFNSIAEMAKYWNINKSTLKNRLNGGWSIPQAIEISLHIDP